MSKFEILEMNVEIYVLIEFSDSMCIKPSFQRFNWCSCESAICTLWTPAAKEIIELVPDKL